MECKGRSDTGTWPDILKWTHYKERHDKVVLTLVRKITGETEIGNFRVEGVGVNETKEGKLLSDVNISTDNNYESFTHEF